MIKFFKTLFILSMLIALATCSTQNAGVRGAENTHIAEFGSPQDSDRFFLYIPDNDELEDYMAMLSYLRDWDNGRINVSDDDLNVIFTNHFGNNTIHGLLFDAFLRHAGNPGVRRRIIQYFNDHNLETGFTASLRKLYEAVPSGTLTPQGEQLRYIYNNSEYDENIDLFNARPSALFNDELALLLVENNWTGMPVNIPGRPDEQAFFLTYGGNTNTLTVIFKKYSRVLEGDITEKMGIDFYRNRFNGNWNVTELPLERILSRSGADRYIIAYGYGPETNPRIEGAVFNAYLYRRTTSTLYEISYYMNIAPENIHFSERTRMFNMLFFQTLYAFLPIR